MTRTDDTETTTPSLPAEAEELRIDLGGVLAQKLGRRYRWVPRWLVRWLEKVIRQTEMNEMLHRTRGLRDAEFCRGLLSHWDISLDVTNPGAMPPASERRVVLVCNHPLGGLDGLSLIDLISRHFGGQVWFVVNDLLMAVKPLRGVFLPINKHGQQSRQASADIDNAFDGPDPIIIFPAGLVSRRIADPGIDPRKKCVADLPWQKMFVNKCIKAHRDIIPMHFNGENSSFFYKFANLRKSLGLKLNIEMVLLPREMLRCKGRRFSLTFGKPIAWQSLRGGPNAAACAADIRRIVYELKTQK